ncbi:hypothetical protein C8R47DRAFT_1214984 [Mycena vitilis]|nr:hypothetical protein C8R47DRAFT_1214984 [Mycena vitilis]
MLRLSQPDDAERFEGCPVVDLLDAAEDVKVFFKTLFDYDFFLPYPERTEYATVIGVLRLSNNFMRLAAYASAPFTHRETHEEIGFYSSGEKASYTVPDHTLPSLIRVGREVYAQWNLPSAFYPGIQFSAGKTNFVLLSGALRTHKMSEFLNFLWHPEDIPGCCNTMTVVCCLKRYASRRWADGQRHLSPLDLPIKIGEMGICSVCTFFLENALETAQAELKDSMPAIFNLPSWTELEAMKLAALQ